MIPLPGIGVTEAGGFKVRNRFTEYFEVKYAIKYKEKNYRIGQHSSRLGSVIHIVTKYD